MAEAAPFKRLGQPQDIAEVVAFFCLMRLDGSMARSCAPMAAWLEETLKCIRKSLSSLAPDPVLDAPSPTALAIAGNTVYASMQFLKERNQDRVDQLSRFAAEKQVDLRALELDVLSEESIKAAFDQVLLETGRLDVVVNTAGMLVVGIAEAFTPAQMARILDINTISWLRVNRAALLIMRRQKEGVLVYIGSTTSRIHEPFIGPYIASKAAGEALAEAMSFEAAPFGIESVIVVPGAFTSGTEHFADAHGPRTLAVVSQYGELADRLRGLGTALEVLDGEKGLGIRWQGGEGCP